GAPYAVVGVMPDEFQDPLVSKVDAWIPVNLTPGHDVSNADNHYFSSIVRLKPTVTIEQAEAELGTLMRRLGQKYPNARDAAAHYVPLHEDVVGSSGRVLEILLGAVGLVLLLVCVNVANLLLVRSADRAREFAVRSALGAERSRLIRQMAVESLVLA